MVSGSIDCGMRGKRISNQKKFSLAGSADYAETTPNTEKGSGLQFWNLLQFFRKGRRGAIFWRQVWRRLRSGNRSGRRPQRHRPSNLRPADPDQQATPTEITARNQRDTRQEGRGRIEGRQKREETERRTKGRSSRPWRYWDDGRNDRSRGLTELFAHLPASPWPPK